MRDKETDVLVVGAGPVGLMAGLFLAHAGVKAQVVDREVGPTVRSYACALHPRSLKYLQQLGLLEAVTAAGRKVSKVAFYEQELRRAELDLAESGSEFPYLLIVPQDALEQLLENSLVKITGKAVLWSHRLVQLQRGEDSVHATIEELTGTSMGYTIPHWETVVKNRFDLRSKLVIGADGHASLVRQQLHIEPVRAPGRQAFAAYEFLTDDHDYNEVRVVMAPESTSVLWPLPGNKCRWTFQLLHSEVAEFPGKERRAIRLSDESTDQKIRAFVQDLARKRAPWFNLPIKGISWCSEVVFEHFCVKTFGIDRCWLAGDAAHQTGPVGVQSMNAGFSEAQAISAAFAQNPSAPGLSGRLQEFNQANLARWQQLLGLTGGLRSGPKTDLWIKDRTQRLLESLPATDDALERLAAQLQLQFG
jgi:2-polyprenyl-6-methoxyphenol hydroxylase-like FAD-dependent oxidoreductase